MLFICQDWVQTGSAAAAGLAGATATAVNAAIAAAATDSFLTSEFKSVSPRIGNFVDCARPGSARCYGHDRHRSMNGRSLRRQDTGTKPGQQNGRPQRRGRPFAVTE